MNYKEELQKIYTKEIPEYSTEFLNNEFILYGAGSLGSMAVDLLEKRGLRPEYIVDKSAKGNIKGIKIISTEEIPDIDKLVLTPETLKLIDTLLEDAVKQYGLYLQKGVDIKDGDDVRQKIDELNLERTKNNEENSKA